MYMYFLVIFLAYKLDASMVTSLNLTFEVGHTNVTDHYKVLTNFTIGCLQECNRDSNCNGYMLNGRHCFLSKCNRSIDVQCFTCIFGRRLNPTSTVSCPFYTNSSITITTASSDDSVETTQQSRNVSVSSVANATENDSNVMFCPCVCKNASQTLNESIKMRRNELRVNKTLLTSTIRRRTSASDYRMSSRVIGAGGVIIIVMFGMLIICSDIFSVFYFKSHTV